MGNRLVTVGQYVTPGRVLVKLVNPAELRIRYKLLQAIGKPTPGFIIPAKSLQYDVKGPFVFLDNNGKAWLQRVTVVHNADGHFIVTAGLKSGESVVVNGVQNKVVF